MASTEELACVYSALILQDGDVQVSVDKIQAILKAASVDVEPYWPGIFAKAVETLNLKDLISNVGSGAGGAAGGAGDAAGAGAAAGQAEEKKEEKKEEEEEEEDDDMGFGLFD